MRTRLSFIALTVIVLALAATLAGNLSANTVGAGGIFLPMMSAQIATGAINVYYLQSDPGGGFNVPLTGGGQQEFQVDDYFDRPLGGIDITAIENQDGVTLVVAGEGAGYTDTYHPFLASFGAAPGAPDHFRLSPSAPININLTPVSQSNRYGEGNGLIIEHILNLPDYAPGWQQDTGNISDYCDVAVADDSWGAIVGHSIQATAAPASGLQFHVNFDVYGGPGGGSTVQECDDLLSGPGNYNQLIISNPNLGAFIFAADSSVSNNNGVVYGRISDDGSGLSLAGATVTLSGLLDSPDAVSATESFPNGWYRLEGVAAGDYMLEIERDGYAPETTNVSVGPGGAAEAGETPMELTDPAFLIINNLTGGVSSLWIFQYGLELVEDTIPIDGSAEYELSPGDYHLAVITTACSGLAELDISLAAGETLELYHECVPIPPDESRGAMAALRKSE
jgi:hypothetical protein